MRRSNTIIAFRVPSRAVHSVVYLEDPERECLSSAFSFRERPKSWALLSVSLMASQSSSIRHSPRGLSQTPQPSHPLLEALPNTLGFLTEMRFQALLHLRHICGKSSSSPGETLFRYL